MQQVRMQMYSALEKLTHERSKVAAVLTECSGLWGETVSFQIACRFAPDSYEDYYTQLTVECPQCEVKVYQVEQVPCSFPCLPTATGDYLTRTPGLMPDPLQPYNGEPIRLNAEFNRVFWVDVTIPKGAQSTAIQIACHSRTGHRQAQAVLPLTVVPMELPPQQMHHSEWLYADCLCHQYGLEIFSEEFFDTLGHYLRCATAHGVDTLLTPVFTPSLDVEPGGRRMPCQLVKITKQDGEFRFDFSLLRRWVTLAQECGIRRFEIAPFFTQWGAKFAAEIYLDTETGRQTLFGWDTPALSDEYAAFLAAFLPQLLQQLCRLGIKERTFFHVSDEPSEEHLEDYRAARSMIEPYIDGCPILDALSSHAFYKQGLVSIPVVAEDFLQSFLEEERKGAIWTYSCCCQDKQVPNVFLSMPSVRGRILGVLMYKEQLDGFLRWGFNFWNSQFSREPINPYQVTDAGLGFPSGDAFLVYPGRDKKPVESLRLKLLRDAFQDARALFLLEETIGRQAVLDLICQYLGEISFAQYPSDVEVFEAFRHTVNRRLQKEGTQ